MVYVSMGSMVIITSEQAQMLISGATQAKLSVVWSLRKSNQHILQHMTYDPDSVLIAEWAPQVIHQIQLELDRVSQCGCVCCANTICAPAELFALSNSSQLLFFKIKKGSGRVLYIITDMQVWYITM